MTHPRRACLTALLLAFLLLTLREGESTCAQGLPQSPPQSPPLGPPKPQKTDKQAEPPSAKEPDYSQEAFLLEQFKVQYRFEQDGTGQREMNVRVRVQSEAGLTRFGQLIFPYSSANEKLEINFVRVLKADGSSVTASESNVQDLTAPIALDAPIYTDLRQKHVTVPGLRPGDVLEYHLIWRIHTPLAQNHFWLEHEFAGGSLISLDDQLEVNIPSESKVKLKTASGVEPKIKEENGRRIYSWKRAHLKRDDEQDKEALARKKREEDEPRRPQVQMTTFQSWAEVGQWYSLLERDRIIPDEKVRAKAQELVRGRTTDKDKIEALYQFVAKNFRYVSLSLGQGRYQPHAAAAVLANQYGDCKDKHTLFSSLLIAAGLRAYPVLINSSRKIDIDVPSPAQFDHVISAIPLGTETLWADTTAEVAPFRLLSPGLRDKKALLIPANDPARLESTPVALPFLTSELLDMVAEVDELGKLSGHTHLKLRGDSEMLFRAMFRSTPKSDWKHLGYYLSMAGGATGEVSDIKPSDPAATNQPFEVEYDFSKEAFLGWGTKKAKLNIPLPSLHLTFVARDKQEDSKPIQLGPPGNITYRLKLSLPKNYQASLPLPLTVTRDYAEYGSTYKLEGNTVVVERKFHLRQHEIPASRAQDYQAFVAAARADEAQTLAVETAVAGTPNIPDTVKVEELVQAAQAAEKNENYPLVEELLKRVIEKEPKHKEARRSLGWALFSQRKLNPAIEVLREQTKINPFDDYAYNLLGQAFWEQQNYEEAEASFRKQIEVTPLDDDAHGNLGLMLVEWRKFKEAVPELEKAISLKPEWEMLYVGLGRAYLNLGNKQGAAEAFEKAIKLSPEPGVWNDVAYNLALSRVELDKAQQYAESAVTAIATELRNAEIEQLTIEDLQNSNVLVAYWDTLGWVHFEKGNLDAAEKYITAAWILGQHSEVAYHLGQINEKRGQTDKAIQMYALAAVSNRLVPEARESLDKLAGKDKSEALMKNAKEVLGGSNTVKLGSLLKDAKENQEAEYYVVLVPGSARKAQVDEVKFIRGSERLRPLSAALKGASHNFSFPDDTKTKVIRRGTLRCQAKSGECSFFMLSPESVTSVD